MTRYSIDSGDRTFVKGYRFLYFAKNMGKNIGKRGSKNISGKCSQKFMDHAKQSATVVIKTALKRAIQKTIEASGDLIVNKIVAKVTKVSRDLPQNKSETAANETEYRKIYICRKKTTNY